MLSFLDTGAMSDVDRRELASRDAEATWYDTIFGDYTNAVEVPTTVARIGVPDGPVLDFGAGTGRVTTHLAKTFDQPVQSLSNSQINHFAVEGRVVTGGAAKAYDLAIAQGVFARP